VVGYGGISLLLRPYLVAAGVVAAVALTAAPAVAVPQGAPETGGGGMAAEVGSWN
jgi:hypothetical protein